MPGLPSPATGLTITNPLILYRSLVATKRIDPDPAQHRLALHLQKVYLRLIDFSPEVDYGTRLKQISRAIGSRNIDGEEHNAQLVQGSPSSGWLGSFRVQRDKSDTRALTKVLTSYDAALKLTTPKGFMLHGEVGTGKSMLIDLLFTSLPNRKKRRWHFNTFMLETLARLEELRQHRLSPSLSARVGHDAEEYSLLWLAREMILTSPILFLDEFQLPDRAASKLLSNLMTSFFQLGGVLVATSNRMPEELAKAAGVDFASHPGSASGSLIGRLGLGGVSGGSKSEGMFAGRGEFATFLEVLKMRCEIWNIEGTKDYRRSEASKAKNIGEDEVANIAPTATSKDMYNSAEPSILPKHYYVGPPREASEETVRAHGSSWNSDVCRAISQVSTNQNHGPNWRPANIRVYGREVHIPRQESDVCLWTFDELCGQALGPADYVTLASTYHTFIIVDLPVLTLLQKNEARRLITLLDALYECKCKLLIRAEAGPDDILFPEQNISRGTANSFEEQDGNEDAVYPETFSEIHQDLTSPFRPNISTYSDSTSSLDSSPIVSISSAGTPGNLSLRSIMADEDADFGHVRAQRQNPHRLETVTGLNFAQTSAFTGEDERFAYKRARSRMWEMCGERWWNRSEDGWWAPVAREVRRWEGSSADNTHLTKDDAVTAVLEAAPALSSGLARDACGKGQDGTSPFRTDPDPPPKFSWVHAWGMMRWGKKAGTWGQGPEGLQARKEAQSADKHKTQDSSRKE